MKFEYPKITEQEAINEALRAFSANQPFNAMEVLLRYKNQQEIQRVADQICEIANSEKEKVNG